MTSRMPSGFFSPPTSICWSSTILYSANPTAPRDAGTRGSGMARLQVTETHEPNAAGDTTHLRWRALQSMVLLSLTCSAGYQFANWAAGLHPHVGSIHFDWEKAIPFLPWTIVPYWTIDPLFCLAFFLCTDTAELKCHVRRVLTAQ